MDSKLCPRHTTRFKRCSPRNSNTVAAAKTTSTSLAMREETMFKKAYELSTLCDIEVCVLYYGREGELIKTWPEDKAKVRDMAERFSQLSDREKRKKSTNLSEFLAKKMSEEKKLLEMEDSLERRLPILQDHLRLLSDCGIPQPLINLPTSLVEDQSRQQWTQPLTNPLSELPSLNHHHDQTKFSIFLYNHDNANFTQLASSFDQSAPIPFSNLMNSTALLGAQGFAGCNNNIVHLPPPLMQFSSFYI